MNRQRIESIHTKFQLTAARRRLVSWHNSLNDFSSFQLTAARRRLDMLISPALCPAQFQLTAARRRLAEDAKTAIEGGFNSQPPEGGWHGLIYSATN